MRKPIWTLALIAAVLLTNGARAGEYFGIKKYAIDFTVGGSYSLMQDVNELIANTGFTGYTPSTEINIGAQYGLGIAYRALDDFGWQFGYNRFQFIQNYRMEAFLGSGNVENFAEQSITGAEVYGLATWYWDMFGGEVSFGVGPALYLAQLDRSVDIVNTPGSHLTDGGFADAKGKAIGLNGTLGLELMVGEQTGFIIQLGGRSAVIDKLRYKDRSGNQQIVYRDPYLVGVDPASSYPRLEVDYSGGFVKLSLRRYFEPTSSWRTPKR